MPVLLTRLWSCVIVQNIIGRQSMLLNLILTVMMMVLVIIINAGIVSAMAISKEWKAQEEFKRRMK